ncbi:MAG: response regulator transcription factor [Actinomycetota bacterium]|nr:response regulator transcription factor [Actinomycetota bacterium]MDA8280802.1 response regulator transcription factor [Actinomycetota bacterium]
MDASGRTTVLVAEDDRATRDALVLAFGMEGYVVTAVADGTAALAAMADSSPDVVVLDVMMPGHDGMAVCRRVRAAGDRTPVLLLTARTEVRDRVDGLDAGADDYLTKPFALDELFARVRALVRRTAAGDSDVVSVADLRVDPASRRAWRGDRILDLTKTEFDLLDLLARNAGQVLTHEVIYDRIWGYDFGADSKNLAVYIGYVRRKLEEAGEARLIETVRGVGYVLRAP